MSCASHALKRVVLRPRPARRQGLIGSKRWLSTTDDVIRGRSFKVPCMLDIKLTPAQEGDVVILRRIKKPSLLAKPLKSGESIGTNFGNIRHDDIIGKSYRDTVKSSQNKYARIHRPTLGEYVTLTPRLVTPVGSRSCAAVLGPKDQLS